MSKSCFLQLQSCKKPCFLQKYIYFLCWFIFKVLLKFRKFEPQYSYKIYSSTKTSVSKQTRFWLFFLQCFSIFGKILLLQ